MRCWHFILSSFFLSSPLLVKYYEPDKPLVLQRDRFMREVSCMGVSLLQNENPVAHASLTLATTEINYAQTEKEVLPTIFGEVRFQQYRYGRNIVKRPEHKT